MKSASQAPKPRDREVDDPKRDTWHATSTARAGPARRAERRSTRAARQDSEGRATYADRPDRAAHDDGDLQQDWVSTFTARSIRAKIEARAAADADDGRFNNPALLEVEDLVDVTVKSVMYAASRLPVAAGGGVAQPGEKARVGPTNIARACSAPPGASASSRWTQRTAPPGPTPRPEGLAPRRPRAEGQSRGATPTMAPSETPGPHHREEVRRTPCPREKTSASRPQASVTSGRLKETLAQTKKIRAPRTLVDGPPEDEKEDDQRTREDAVRERRERAPREPRVDVGDDRRQRERGGQGDQEQARKIASVPPATPIASRIGRSRYQLAKMQNRRPAPQPTRLSSPPRTSAARPRRAMVSRAVTCPGARGAYSARSSASRSLLIPGSSPGWARSTRRARPSRSCPASGSGGPWRSRGPPRRGRSRPSRRLVGPQRGGFSPPCGVVFGEPGVIDAQVRRARRSRGPSSRRRGWPRSSAASARRR